MRHILRTRPFRGDSNATVLSHFCISWFLRLDCLKDWNTSDPIWGNRSDPDPLCDTPVPSLGPGLLLMMFLQKPQDTDPPVHVWTASQHMPGDTELEPRHSASGYKAILGYQGKRKGQNDQSGHASQLPSHACSDFMFMFNTRSLPLPSEASLYQTVCLEDRLSYQNKTVPPPSRLWTKLVTQYRSPYGPRRTTPHLYSFLILYYQQAAWASLFLPSMPTGCPPATVL